MKSASNAIYSVYHYMKQQNNCQNSSLKLIFFFSIFNRKTVNGYVSVSLEAFFYHPLFSVQTFFIERSNGIWMKSFRMWALEGDPKPMLNSTAWQFSFFCLSPKMLLVLWRKGSRMWKI